MPKSSYQPESGILFLSMDVLAEAFKRTCAVDDIEGRLEQLSVDEQTMLKEMLGKLSVAGGGAVEAKATTVCMNVNKQNAHTHETHTHTHMHTHMHTNIHTSFITCYHITSHNIT